MRWIVSAVTVATWAAIQTSPVMRLVPPRLELRADTSGFAVGRVQVLNHGSEPLHIHRVATSCKCAAATVLKNPVYPLEVGQLLVRVNTRDWQDTVGTVELEIVTNAPDSITHYIVRVRR
ncbi:MAG: DUF1573 domain-containing protein [Chlorobi bacterium]|jgi:hypothetical protein|nr:DUF1573 domain-containing protein [Chlorobiota bacterium]